MAWSKSLNSFKTNAWAEKLDMERHSFMTIINQEQVWLAGKNDLFEHFFFFFNMIEKFNSYTKNLVLKKESKLYIWNQEYEEIHIKVSRA